MIQARLQISGQINGREKLSGGLNTSIKEIKPELENIKIIPKTEQQKFKSEKYGYDEVIVERVTADIDSSIKPENIKKGETILGVKGGYEGVDTSDGNIVSQDLNVGKVAYSQGKRIEGTYDTSKNVGVTPYKNLKIMSDQTSLANYYIEKFKDGTIKNANTYVLKTKSKNKDNNGKLDVAEFMFCSNTPALIFAQSIGDYKNNYFFHKEFTENFIQFDNQLGAGLTASFINQKGITQAELLELEGWYDENLNLIIGDIECGTCIVQYIAKINIFDYFSNKVTPQNLIPCSNLDELNINISYDEYSTFNEKFIDLDFFLNSRWLSLDNEALPSDIAEGKTAYNGYGKITGTGKMLTVTEDATATPSDILIGKTAYVNNEKIEGKYQPLDTSDATVNPNQILEGQTAYANGQKIEGTMPNNGALSFEPSDEEQNIPTGYVEGAKVEATDITKLNEYDACLTLANSIETTEDYTDTTATAEDIKEGKVAYSNGERIVGTAQINDLVITDAGYLFYHGVRIKQLSKILPLCGELTNMEYMFNGGEFGSINLDAYKLNTSNVTLMRHMFSGCNSVKSINITSFDTSNVTDMSYMFGTCFLLNDIDFSNFDTSNVTNIGYMFTNDYSLVDLDLSSFDLSKVNYGITNIFYGCSGLTNLKSFKNLGKGYGNKGYNYNSYSLSFESCKKITHESLMDVITNGLYDLNLTYDVANGGLLYTQKLILGTTNLAKLTAEEIAIATAKGWTVS